MISSEIGSAIQHVASITREAYPTYRGICSCVAVSKGQRILASERRCQAVGGISSISHKYYFQFSFAAPASILTFSRTP
jgi:NAD(P)H-nitrite reductase large subunit